MAKKVFVTILLQLLLQDSLIFYWIQKCACDKALFQDSNGQFYSATAKTIEEATRLLEAGFEYVCSHENVMLMRKRK